MSSSSRASLDPATAARFAAIALGHVTREQPNVIAHVSPRSVHPIFFGSLDWHSCVHSYWLLATLYRLFPKLLRRDDIAALFTGALTPEKVKGELAYLEPATARGFERPYGWAWLLMLQAELKRHEHQQQRTWTSALKPLADLFAARFREHLPKSTYPVRSGVHGNTAFALALSYEYAIAHDKPLAELLRKTARAWYGNDRDCQASSRQGRTSSPRRSSRPNACAAFSPRPNSIAGSKPSCRGLRRANRQHCSRPLPFPTAATHASCISTVLISAAYGVGETSPRPLGRAIRCASLRHKRRTTTSRQVFPTSAAIIWASTGSPPSRCWLSSQGSVDYGPRNTSRTKLR